MMLRLNVPTRRGSVLNGVLFRPQEKRSADTVMIAITGMDMTLSLPKSQSSSQKC